MVAIDPAPAMNQRNGVMADTTLAEEEGVEPPRLLHSAVFKTAAVANRLVLPCETGRRGRGSNPQGPCDLAPLATGCHRRLLACPSVGTTCSTSGDSSCPRYGSCSGGTSRNTGALHGCVGVDVAPTPTHVPEGPGVEGDTDHFVDPELDAHVHILRSGGRDLNSRHPAPKAGALPV